MKHLLWSLCLGFFLAAAAVAQQPKLAVDARLEGVEGQTKFTVTFRNRSQTIVRDIKIYKVGLPGFHREFCPAYRIGSIAPGKTYTLTVWLKGTVDYMHPDEVIVVGASFRAGTESTSVTRQIRVFPDL